MERTRAPACHFERQRRISRDGHAGAQNDKDLDALNDIGMDAQNDTGQPMRRS